MSYKRSATLKLVSIIKIRIYYVKMSLEEATFVTCRSGFALLINNQLPGKHMLNLTKKRRRAVYHSTGNVQEVICVVQKELRPKYREGNKQGELELFIPSWRTCKTWVCWNSNHFQALAHGVRPSACPCSGCSGHLKKKHVYVSFSSYDKICSTDWWLQQDVRALQQE